MSAQRRADRIGTVNGALSMRDTLIRIPIAMRDRRQLDIFEVTYLALLFGSMVAAYTHILVTYIYTFWWLSAEYLTTVWRVRCSRMPANVIPRSGNYMHQVLWRDV